MFSRRIRTVTVALASAIGLGMALTACGPENSDYTIYRAATANGFTHVGDVDYADDGNTMVQKVSAQVGECPVILALMERGDIEKYAVTFNGRLGDKISDRILTPKDGAGALPSAAEIANVLNNGQIAKERGITDPKKVLGSRFGVCDPNKPTPSNTSK